MAKSKNQTGVSITTRLPGRAWSAELMSSAFHSQAVDFVPRVRLKSRQSVVAKRVEESIDKVPGTLHSVERFGFRVMNGDLSGIQVSLRDPAPCIQANPYSYGRRSPFPGAPTTCFRMSPIRAVEPCN